MSDQVPSAAARPGATPLSDTAPRCAAGRPFGSTWSSSLRRVGEAELRRWLDLATAVCDAADAMALGGFRHGVAVDTKPDRTWVTEVDRSIEHMARERLRTGTPGCGVLGEEEGHDEPGASVQWLVDPIDGTSNFVRGIPVFATLLAAGVEGELQLAAVSAPAMRERWLAWRGGGAWAGSRRLAVSSVGRIENAQLLYGSRTDDLRSGRMPGLDETVAGAWRERGFGDFWAYMLVAEGAAEAMFETGARPWDLGAPLVIVEEAGGVLTTVDGERTVFGDSSVVSNGLVHDELLARLRRRP